MLALKDQHGYIPASLPGLANAARVAIEDCEKALAILEAPDKYSRSTDFDGRRIEKVDGGWLVLNHLKYRDRKGPSSDPTAAERQRRYRERHGSNGPVTASNGVTALRYVTPVYVSVSGSSKEGMQWECESHVNHSESHVNHSSASASSSAKEGMQGENGAGRKTSAPPTESEAQAYAMEIDFEEWSGWYDHFQANGWLVGGKSKMKDWRAAMRNGKRMSAKFAKGRAGNNGKRTNAEKAEDWKRQAAEQAKARPPISSMPPEFNLDDDSADSGLSMLGCDEVQP
jgi:hypothetical protein